LTVVSGFGTVIADKMEEHFLKDFVSGPRSKERDPWYNPDGDCIIYHTADEATVAERVDELLTIYKSAISGKAIGFQIKGVGAIIKTFGLGGVEVECEEHNKEIMRVSISALLLAAYESGPKTIGRRKAYIDAFEFAPRQTSLTIDPVSF